MAGPSGGAAPGESRSDRPRVRARRRRASHSPRRMSGVTFALDGAVARGIPSAKGKGHRIIGEGEVTDVAAKMNAKVIGPGQEIEAAPDARGAARIVDYIMKNGSVDLDSWEPDYGRLAEAQVKWEAAHGRPLKA